MIKYLVFPGWVRSKNDGDLHYINATRLMQLYKVNPNECIIVDDRPYTLLGYNQEFLDSLKPLMPRYDGNYTLEEV